MCIVRFDFINRNIDGIYRYGFVFIYLIDCIGEQC